jgi:hypothetical protein
MKLHDVMVNMIEIMALLATCLLELGANVCVDSE